MLKTLLVLLSSGWSCICFAQLEAGAKLGYNLANLSYSGTLTLEGQKPRSSFNAGVFANLPVSSTFSLQAELLYSGQGTMYQNNLGSGSIQYDYLNIPLIIRYTHFTGLFLETGLQIGFLLSSKAKLNGVTIDQPDKTYGHDYAWAMGLGYRIPNTGLGIDLRYNLGLVNIVNNPGDANVKNSVFQFDVYYQFGTNSK